MSLSEYIEKLDKDLFLFINRNGADWFDPVMIFASHRGFWIPFYAFLLYLVYRVYKKRTLLFFVTVSLCVFLSDKFSVYMKNAFMRYRPCHNLEFHELLRLPDGCGGQYGFVSSHAANTMGIALFLTYFLKDRYQWIGYVMIPWALFVSFSRVYLGAHYPLDILGGYLVGLIAALLSIYVHKTFDRRFFNAENSTL